LTLISSRCSARQATRSERLSSSAASIAVSRRADVNPKASSPSSGRTRDRTVASSASSSAGSRSVSNGTLTPSTCGAAIRASTSAAPIRRPGAGSNGSARAAATNCRSSSRKAIRARALRGTNPCAASARSHCCARASSDDSPVPSSLPARVISPPSVR